MELWPAIDLRGGKCVRLLQGDYSQEIVYGEPAEMARRWVGEGAKRLHLVDLDGARDGTGANLNAVAEIVKAVDVPCQLGGGIRDEESIRVRLEMGIARLVIGTQAQKNPDWFRWACERFPDRLVLGIDARNGRVATDGWLETSEVSAFDLARQFENLPLCGVIYTDISRDGMLMGPNFDTMAEMNDAVPCPVIASGGVTTLHDIRRLKDLGLAGAILGRALYEGNLELPAALVAAGEGPPD